jgi:hypothetical protein
MSKTFVISIEGNAEAEAFLRAVQNQKQVGYPDKNPDLFSVVSVLFIYPIHDDEERRPKGAKRHK